MKFTKKSLILLASLLLAVCLTVGGTLAFLVATDGPLPNTFTPSQVTTSVTEKTAGGVKSEVKIQNTGDTEAYIRAAIIVTWQNENGEVYGKVPVAGSDYTITWGSSKWDRETTDGFYYYADPVAAGASTEALIASIQPGAACPDSDYKLNVEIIGSGIQSKPTSVVANEWGVTVSGTTISK